LVLETGFFTAEESASFAAGATGALEFCAWLKKEAAHRQTKSSFFIG
jgi:hypothetical protein